MAMVTATPASAEAMAIIATLWLLIPGRGRMRTIGAVTSSKDGSLLRPRWLARACTDVGFGVPRPWPGCEGAPASMTPRLGEAVKGRSAAPNSATVA